MVSLPVTVSLTGTITLCGREEKVPFSDVPLSLWVKGHVLPPRSLCITVTVTDPCRERTWMWPVGIGAAIHCSVPPPHIASKHPSLISYQNMPTASCPAPGCEWPEGSALSWWYEQSLSPGLPFVACHLLSKLS